MIAAWILVPSKAALVEVVTPRIARINPAGQVAEVAVAVDLYETAKTTIQENSIMFD